MSNPTYTQYPWLISFADLTDEVIIRLGDVYLNGHPSATQNYYHITAINTLDFVQTKGVQETEFNLILVPHTLIKKLQINYLQLAVCESNTGLSDIELQYDKYYIKAKSYRTAVQQLESRISYEMIVNPTWCSTTIRAGSNSFNIYNG
jgi:hypothetical protein